MTAARLFAPDGHVVSSADFSPCGRYRYALRRVWNPDAPPVLFVGLNPSTADASRDDPTIRRCIRFARDWGAGGLLMGNLYAYRSTDPRGLKVASDPLGPETDERLQALASVASRVLVAWGAWPGPDVERPARVAALLDRPGFPVLEALALTKNGAPRHPLYMRADARPVRWFPPGAKGSPC